MHIGNKRATIAKTYERHTKHPGRKLLLNMIKQDDLSYEMSYTFDCTSHERRCNGKVKVKPKGNNQLFYR